MSVFSPFHHPFGLARISSTQQRAKYEVLPLLDHSIAGKECHPQRRPADSIFRRIVLYRHGAGVDRVFGPAGVSPFLSRAAPAQRSHRSVLSQESTAFSDAYGYFDLQLHPRHVHRMDTSASPALSNPTNTLFFFGLNTLFFFGLRGLGFLYLT